MRTQVCAIILDEKNRFFLIRDNKNNFWTLLSSKDVKNNLPKETIKETIESNLETTSSGLFHYGIRNVSPSFRRSFYATIINTNKLSDQNKGRYFSKKELESINIEDFANNILLEFIQDADFFLWRLEKKDKMKKVRYNLETLNYIEAKPEKDSQIVLIGLHGLGDSADGFSFLADHIGENFHYFFPYAPLNYFNVGYAWYMMTKNMKEQAEDIRKSQILFDEFLEYIIKEHKLENKKIVMFGFSQGAVMTLIYTLKNPIYFSGAISLSGYLFQPENIVVSKDTVKVPYLVTHGDKDNIIPLRSPFAGRDIEKFLKGKKIDVTYKEFHMAHEITPKVIEKMKDWINHKI